MADGGVFEGGPSGQFVVTLSGPLAASSLAQDAREAGGAMAPLVVVARAAVLTAHHRVVTHPSCEEKARRAEKTGRARLVGHSERINRHVLGARAASSHPVRSDLCPQCTASVLGRVRPRTSGEEWRTHTV